MIWNKKGFELHDLWICIEALAWLEAVSSLEVSFPMQQTITQPNTTYWNKTTESTLKLTINTDPKDEIILVHKKKC